MCWRGHGEMINYLGPKTKAALRKRNLTSLFVMTHPVIRPIVTDKLQAVSVHTRAHTHTHTHTRTRLRVPLQVQVQGTGTAGKSSRR